MDEDRYSYINDPGYNVEVGHEPCDEPTDEELDEMEEESND